MKRPLLAIDVDDVVASTMEAARLWAHRETGVALTREDYHTRDTYWEYYNAIWARHGLSDRIRFETFLADMERDQSHIAVTENARVVIDALRERYDMLFLTSRPMEQRDATRAWLDEHVASDIPLFIAHNPFTNADARSKGEICAEMGVSVLIDDNIGNCQSALDYGVQAILFGWYGWNEHDAAHLVRCTNWVEVGECLLHDKQK